MQISKNRCSPDKKQYSHVYFQVVDPAGLEPATPALSRRCSNQLSYGSEVPSVGGCGPRFQAGSPPPFINGGGKETRTPDIKLAKLALYQLSYTPR
jgi:hypothetical protein